MGSSSSKTVLSVVNQFINKVVTNVVNKHTQSVSNSVINKNLVRINMKNSILECGGDFDINQSIQSHVNTTQVININESDSIAAEIQTQIQTNIDQISKQINDMFATIGTSISNDTETYLKNSITNFFNNNITKEFVSNIVTSVVNINENTITIIDSKISGDKCDFSQNILSDMQADALIKNISQSLVSDSAFSRVQDMIKQESETQNRGIVSIAEGFFNLMGKYTYIVIAFILAGTVLGYTFLRYGGPRFIDAVSDPKFMITAGALVGAFILISFFLKTGPFKSKAPPEHWGCKKDKDGYNTGECIKYSTGEEGPYSDEKTCLKSASITCGKYFACNKQSHTCRQVTDPVTGPYQDVDICKQACV